MVGGSHYERDEYVNESVTSLGDFEHALATCP